ncbi:MAG: response regulator transcription factor [Planctomycetaceae bacterium]|nr:response regulator transcription factor [Planctomycetaceae bacterium]
MPRCGFRSPVRVLIVDDHRIVRAGLIGLLSTRPEIDVVGEASDGFEAVDLAERLEPDVVLMDVTMPRLNGIDATRLLHRKRPEIRIIGLSMHDSREIEDAMKLAGARQFITKGGPPLAVIEAILATE